jgi:hypothetical protein
MDDKGKIELKKVVVPWHGRSAGVPEVIPCRGQLKLQGGVTLEASGLQQWMSNPLPVPVPNMNGNSYSTGSLKQSFDEFKKNLDAADYLGGPKRKPEHSNDLMGRLAQDLKPFGHPRAKIDSKAALRDLDLNEERNQVRVLRHGERKWLLEQAPWAMTERVKLEYLVRDIHEKRHLVLMDRKSWRTCEVTKTSKLGGIELAAVGILGIKDAKPDILLLDWELRWFSLEQVTDALGWYLGRALSQEYTLTSGEGYLFKLEKDLDILAWSSFIGSRSLEVFEVEW